MGGGEPYTNRETPASSTYHSTGGSVSTVDFDYDLFVEDSGVDGGLSDGQLISLGQKGSYTTQRNL